MAKLEPVPSLAALRDALERGFRGPAWHGPSVRTALRGVSHELASVRLAAERNSIWEIVLHLAYARHRVLVRLSKVTSLEAVSFPRRLRSSWWPELPDSLGADAWAEDRNLLDQYQELLMEALERIPGELLATRRSDRWTYGDEILGVIFHDAYHTGQIRLIAAAAASGKGES